MQASAFEQVYPVVRRIATQKAHRLIRSSGVSRPDADDLQSQLLLRFYVRFSRFDPKRASIQTFASRILDNEIRSFLRHKNAIRRRHLAISYSNVSEDDISRRPASGASGQQGQLSERAEFWMDVQRAIGPENAELYSLATELANNGPTEVAESRDLSRATIYNRIDGIRELFVKAGIDADYFVPRRKADHQLVKRGAENSGERR
jgi:RNA polymerase sigma factor (sigma-70 family)